MKINKNITLFICTSLVFSCQDGSDSLPKNIYSDDDRISYDINNWPWSTFGRLDSGCTAVAISSTLVLTTAHCVWDSQKQEFKESASEFDFRFGSSTGQNRIPIRSVWFGNKQPEEFRSDDWAILQLDRKVTSPNGFLKILPNDIASSLPQDVQIVGYMGDCDGGNQLCGQASCQLLKKGEGDRILNNCDTASGVSGSPVLAKKNGTTTIVGIAVSEYRQGASQSLTLEDYSDDYANVAIASIQFSKIVESIESSLLGGELATNIDGVVYLDVIKQVNPPNGMSNEAWLEDIYLNSVSLISILEDFKEVSAIEELPIFWELSNKYQNDLAAMARASDNMDPNLDFISIHETIYSYYELLKINDQDLVNFVSRNRSILDYGNLRSLFSEYGIYVSKLRELFVLARD
ncbi:MAG: trypsin-like serine peptidase [Oligoflexus sp.]